MDIYAKVKYNRPEQLAGVLEDAFASRFAGFPPLAQIVLDGFSLITLLSSAELKIFLISILS